MFKTTINGAVRISGYKPYAVPVIADATRTVKSARDVLRQPRISRSDAAARELFADNVRALGKTEVIRRYRIWQLSFYVLLSVILAFAFFGYHTHDTGPLPVLLRYAVDLSAISAASFYMFYLSYSCWIIRRRAVLRPSRFIANIFKSPAEFFPASLRGKP